MITGFSFRNLASSYVGSLDLPLRGGTSGLQVVDVEGLTPVNTNIITMDRALRSGSDVLGARPQSRNLVVTMAFNQSNPEGKSIYDIRNDAYKWFAPGAHLEIRIDRSGDLKALETRGYVETVEANIFGTEPLLQVSILCPESFLHEATPTTGGIFVDSGLLYIHTLRSTSSIRYGYVLQISDAVPSMDRVWYVKHSVDGMSEEEVRFDLTGTSATSLTYSTVSGDRYLRLVTPDGTIDRPDLITPSDPWPQMSQGVNQVKVGPTSHNASFSTSIEYRRLYPGI